MPQLCSLILIFWGDTRKPVRGLDSKHTFLTKLMPDWRSTLENWIVMKESAEVQIASVEERVRGASSSSSCTDPCRDLHAFRNKKVSGEFFGHNRSRCQVFASPVVYMSTPFGFSLLIWEVISINTSNMIGNFPRVLDLEQLFLILTHLLCN